MQDPGSFGSIYRKAPDSIALPSERSLSRGRARRKIEDRIIDQVALRFLREAWDEDGFLPSWERDRRDTGAVGIDR